MATPHRWSKGLSIVATLGLLLLAGSPASSGEKAAAPTPKKDAPAAEPTEPAQSAETTEPAQATETAASDLPVRVSGVERVAATAGDVELWLSLRSTADQPLLLNRPGLAALWREATEKTRFQARFRALEVRDEAGKPLPAAFTLQPGELRRVNLIFRGLTEPGSYGGKIALGAAKLQPQEAEISLEVRRGWGGAALLIALGVGLSYLLRLYAGGVRPRLVRRRRLQALLAQLAAIEEDLPGAATADEKLLLTSCRRALQAADEGLSAGTAGDLATLLADSERKLALLPRAFQLGRRVAGLQPASLRPPLAEKLGDACHRLGAKTFPASEAAATEGLLKEVETGIPAAVRAELQRQIQALREAVEKPSALVSPEARRSLVQLTPRLAEASRLLDGGDFAAARRHLLDTRDRYTRTLIEDLAVAAKAAKAPAGADPQAWQQAMKAVESEMAGARRTSDPEAVVAAYRAAAAQFLSAVARGWLANVRQRRKVVEVSKTLSEEERAAYGERLDAIAEKLASAAGHADRLEVDKAAKEYAAVREELNLLVAEAKQRGLTMGGGADGDAEASAAPGDVADVAGVANDAAEGIGFPLPPYSTDHPLTVRQLSWRIFVSDLLYLSIVLAVAVLLGVKLLWADNPTWGSSGDALVAVLWGLGLHQVSDSAFQGVPALAQKLGGGV